MFRIAEMIRVVAAVVLMLAFSLCDTAARAETADMPAQSRELQQHAASEPGNADHMVLTREMQQGFVFDPENAENKALTRELQQRFFSAPEPEDRPALRVGVERDYPPFSMQDAQGNTSGFDFDIANAICRTMKRECVIVPMAFHDILSSLEQGSLDLAVAGLAVKADRKRYMNFSDSYYHSRSLYITGNGVSVTREWMQGKRLGTQKGTAQNALAEKMWKGVAELYTYADHPAMLNALKSGEVDGVIIDGLAAYDFLLSREGSAYTMQALPLELDSPTNKACIGVRKDDEQLLRDVNASLKIIRLSGEYSRIARKYFPFSIY